MIDITAWSRIVVDGFKLVGPAVLAAALLFIAVLGATTAGRVRLRLAHRGLRVLGPGRWRVWVAGTLLPLVAVTALSASFAIESEIRTGPNRMIEVLGSSPRAGGEVFWVLEPGTDHLMNSSEIQPDRIDRDGSGVLAVDAFTAELASIRRGTGERVTGFVLGGAPDPSGLTPTPPVRAGSRCSESQRVCRLDDGQAIVDAADGFEIGETISVRGVPYEVVGFFDRPASLLNRSVIFVASSGGAATSTYGARVEAASRSSVVRAIRPPGSLEVLTTADLEDNNQEFWSGNGTPIMMMLIVLILVFASAAVYAVRRSEHAATQHTLRTLQALGLTKAQSLSIDVARGFISVLLGGAVGVAIGTALVGFLDRSILGFHASVTPVDAAAALGVALLAVAVSAAHALLQRRG